MDPALEPQVRPVAEQLDVVDDRHVQVAVVAAAGAVDLHRRSRGRDGPASRSARSRSLRPHSGLMVSSESIQKTSRRGRAAATRCGRPRSRRTRGSGRRGPRAARRSAASRPPSRCRRRHLVDPRADASRQAGGSARCRGRSCTATAGTGRSVSSRPPPGRLAHGERPGRPAAGVRAGGPPGAARPAASPPALPLAPGTAAGSRRMSAGEVDAAADERAARRSGARTRPGRSRRGSRPGSPAGSSRRPRSSRPRTARRGSRSRRSPRGGSAGRSRPAGRCPRRRRSLALPHSQAKPSRPARSSS